MPPVPPGAGWVTYVRCHDDIGWAITEEDAGRGGRGRATCTGASSPTSTPATSRTRSRAARASRPTRRRATRARAAPRRRWPGSRRRSSAATRVAVELAVRRMLLLYAVAFATAGCRSSTWATSSGCATTPRWARRPRTTPTTTAGCTGRRWTGRPPSAVTTRPRVEGRLWDGLRRLIAARARDPRASTPRASASRCGPATTTCSGSWREHAGDRLLLLANFTPRAPAREPRARPRPRPRARTRRPGRTAGRWRSRATTWCSSPTSTRGSCASSATRWFAYLQVAWR